MCWRVDMNKDYIYNKIYYTRMNTFVYYYLSDTSREPIGRVRATSLHNALEQIASIKRLPTNDILELFGIQKID